MYKLSEVAEKFNLERTTIIESLIDNKLLLDVHTFKKNGITYIDDRGIEILYKLLLDGSTSNEKKLDSNKKNVLDEYKYLDDIGKKIKFNISKLKEDILALDTEIQKKDKFLIDYQDKLLKINKALVKYEENLLIGKL
jgi:predicted nucleic acid-binding protein